MNNAANPANRTRPFHTVCYYRFICFRQPGKRVDRAHSINQLKSMYNETTEKPRRKKTVVSETADRKNSRSLEPGHDEWWERLMMEPGPGESAGTDASVTESMIPSGLVAEEVSGEARRKDTPPEPEDPVRRRTSGRQRRASLEEYRETYLTVPKIRNRKTVFVSEDVRDELDAVVRRLGGRGMSVSGLLENLAREHLAAYRGDIEQWRKI